MNHMLAVNYTNLRDNMKRYMDLITEDGYRRITNITDALITL